MEILKPGTLQGGTKSRYPFLTVTNRRLYFSAYLVRKLELKEWDQLYFVNDGTWWGFYKTENNDGYPLRHQGHASLIIEHITLARAIQKSLRTEGSESFAVKASGKHINDSLLYELITTKKVEKL